jgi:hypothetical protein
MYPQSPDWVQAFPGLGRPIGGGTGQSTNSKFQGCRHTASVHGVLTLFAYPVHYLLCTLTVLTVHLCTMQCAMPCAKDGTLQRTGSALSGQRGLWLANLSWAFGLPQLLYVHKYIIQYIAKLYVKCVGKHVPRAWPVLMYLKQKRVPRMPRDAVGGPIRRCAPACLML